MFLEFALNPEIQMSNLTYTYRGGQKIPLQKRPDQFVVQAQPTALRGGGLPDAESISSAASRVTVRTADLEPEMARSRLVAPTHHAYEFAETGEEFLITDRVLVTFKEALPAAIVAEFAGRYGLRQLQKYSDRDYLFEVTAHTGMNPVKLVVQLTENEPLVAVADNDLTQQVQRYALALPTDPAYVRQWHLHALDHPDVDARAHARCDAAWQLLDSFGSRDVVIGVTDDGCKLDHADFDSSGKFAAWGYFSGSRLVRNTDVDAQPSRMYSPGDNHGTSCAGVIAGEADAVLTVGAAPACRLLPIKWEVTSNGGLNVGDSQMLTMLNFIADKVDVLSNSWGIVPMSFHSTQVINRIAELARIGGRRGQGIVFLWAAGNDNCPLQYDATLSIPYANGWIQQAGGWVWRRPPTARTFRNNLVGVTGVMHVAALASPAQRSHYSNYGQGLSLCAPTNNVHKYWRLDVRGLGVTTTTGETSGVTNEFGGTSSATPLLAGIAALVLSANPNLTALEVISILQRTASKDLDLTPYPRTPPASFDPDTSWDVSPVAPFNRGEFQDLGHSDGSWSPWFGYGRVDAQAAVAAALVAAGVGPAPGPGPAPETPPTPGKNTSNPGLAIPDNNPTGIRNVISITAAGALNFIKILVNIPHPFLGDLRITLHAPSGRSVVLHDRNGGGASNLLKTFDETTTPALRGLRGESVSGDWTLQVADLAARDVGRLERWELELGFAPEEAIEATEAPGIAIPDNKPAGIERKLTLPGPGTVRELSVSIDITHTYIGDLQVTLVAPSGRIIGLHSRSGGGSDRLIATFSSVSVAALQPLRGESVGGTWRLRVADLDRLDVGKLNRWSLRLVKEAGGAAPQTIRPFARPKIIASAKRSADTVAPRRRASRR